MVCGLEVNYSNELPEKHVYRPSNFACLLLVLWRCHAVKFESKRTLIHVWQVFRSCRNGL